MTLDGIVVAALGQETRCERVAAHVSVALLSMESHAEDQMLVPLRRLTLWLAKGRLIVLPLGEFALVVIADRTTDLGITLMEAAGLAKGLLMKSKIEAPA
jgi:predicted regulator of Ras-like GTPase activity (Roadblock/LC7/MglB family)